MSLLDDVKLPDSGSRKSRGNVLDSIDVPSDFSPSSEFTQNIDSVGGSLAAGIGHTLKDIGLQDTGQSLIAYGHDVQLDNTPRVQSFSDIPTHPGKFVQGSAGQMAGQAGLAAAGGLIGGGIGLLGGPFAAVTAPAMAYLGANAGMLLQEYGSARDKQIESGVDDKGRAVYSALANTAIENMGGFKPGGLAGLKGHIISELAGKKASEVIKTIGLKGAKAGLEEAAEEIPQHFIGEVGGGRAFTDTWTAKDSKEALFGAAMAFPGGAAFGASKPLAQHLWSKKGDQSESQDDDASPTGTAPDSGAPTLGGSPGTSLLDSIQMPATSDNPSLPITTQTPKPEKRVPEATFEGRTDFITGDTEHGLARQKNTIPDRYSAQENPGRPLLTGPEPGDRQLLGEGRPNGGNDPSGDQGARRLTGKAKPPHEYEPYLASAARQYDVPEDLLRAVGEHESGLRQFDENGKPLKPKTSNAVGVMQIIPHWHPEFDPEKLASDPAYNISAGAKFLSDLINKHGGDTKAALQDYYGSEDGAANAQYADKVLARIGKSSPAKDAESIDQDKPKVQASDTELERFNPDTASPADLDAVFKPSHELSDGTQVSHIEDNVYQDTDGNEYRDDDATPIEAANDASTEEGVSQAQPVIADTENTDIPTPPEITRNEQSRTTKDEAPQEEASQETPGELPGILTQPKAAYIRKAKMIANKDLRDKPKAEKEKTLSAIDANYDSDYEKALATLPFETYKRLPENKWQSDNILRQTHDALRQDYGIQKTQHGQSSGDLTREQLAGILHREKKARYKELKDAEPSNQDYDFADKILKKDAYGLDYLSNGLNEASKAAFSKATGIKLPRTQSGTQRALRDWAGISERDDALKNARERVELERKKIKGVGNLGDGEAWVDKAMQDGFTQVVKQGGKTMLVKRSQEGQLVGYNLSKRGSGMHRMVGLIEAKAALRELENKREASSYPAQNTIEPQPDIGDNAPIENQSDTHNDANSIQAGHVPETSATNDSKERATRRESGESLATGVAESRQEPDRAESVPGRVPDATGAGKGRDSEQSRSGVDGNREGTVSRPEPSTADVTQNRPDSSENDANTEKSSAVSSEAKTDHVISDEDAIGKGSLAVKFKDNIAAIKIIKALEDERRAATAEEQKALARYVGWGALKGVFDPHNKTWAKQHAELKALLTDAEWQSARASILNAHYTSPLVVKSMYNAAGQLGFKGGRILEPSLGSGNFFGMMPANLKNGSRLFGVELDNLTSRLAKALYPNAVIATSTGFQDYEAPAGYFDMAIGNPPFGSETISDRHKSPYSGFSIHNYFIGKMLDKTRSGGIVAVIVSHSFMDAANPKAREYVASQANLIAGIRLPYTAFKENAGTEVVTDLLFFQKTDTPDAKPAWTESDSATLNDSAEPVSINRYFQENPDQVLGKHTATGKMYRSGQYNVEPTGKLDQQLKDAIARLPKGIYQAVERGPAELDTPDHSIPDGVKPGSFFVNEQDEIRRRIQDSAGQQYSIVWTPRNNGEAGRMRGQIKLRELLRKQMRMERDQDATEQTMERNRQLLNKAYDAFIKEYGFISNPTNRRIFLDDTESSLVEALEFDYDPGVSKVVAQKNGLEEKKPSAVKADIFNRRVLFPPFNQVKVYSATDALLSSLNLKGHIDLEHMAEAYGRSQESIIDELGDLIYQDPQAGWQQSDEYLSGDVKTKLEQAKAAAANDRTLTRNVEALEKVIPKDKLPSEIFAPIGANWIPATVYQAFSQEISGRESSIVYNPHNASWALTPGRDPLDSVKATREYGTDQANADYILTALMNGKPLELKKTVRDPSSSTGYRLETDEKETEAAKQAADKIKSRWASWIWDDADRTAALIKIFNNQHNRIVNRNYDGSHLSLPGTNPAIKLRPNQLNAVWRAIQDRNMLLDHTVGAGKTMAMAAIAMEFRRLGIARKPVFAVMNHTIMQWRTEFARLYPASNVLVATPEDFAKGKRERFFAKFVTGDYDAVIIGHSSLVKMGLSIEIEKKIYGAQLEEISDAIEEAKRNRSDRNVMRDMERIKSNLQEKIKKLLSKAGERDKALTFDELGIDALFVDELHQFKNLFFTTQRQRVSGLGNPAGSGKAFDLFMKIRWLKESIGEKAPLITATGTPVSNSVAEMFTMQRFMQYDQLKQKGLHLFDAWANVYGEDEYVYEVAPSGVGYRISQRFNSFCNMPSLMCDYKSFSDIVTLDTLKQQSEDQGKAFPVPKIQGGKPANIVAERSELQSKFFGVPEISKTDGGEFEFALQAPASVAIEQSEGGKWLIRGDREYGQYDTKAEAEEALVQKSLEPLVHIDPKSILGQFANLKDLTRKTKGKINALSLTGLASKAGLDYRLIDPSAPDFKNSKINRAVNEMMRLYRQWSEDKGAQLVFCDLSIPLSEKTKNATQEKRIFVVNENGDLTHKTGTLHTVPGAEGFPYFLVKNATAKTVDVYEPTTGVLMKSGLADKRSANDFMKAHLATEQGQDAVFRLRDTQPALTEDAIDEYKDLNELETAEDGGNEFLPGNLETVTGAAGFSVYDDIRAKLMAQGVPEKEIAFIHDYDSPKQKSDLFRKVNVGDIRFLLGSTPKLGAGTNVQARLVGLHHIDAPWRPSDLEQREGRIIRQGNKLYARDPENFEVFIGRYATSQTYDTRRWQLLEHKAASIEQLRNYTGENRIEDVSSEASNAADMKAAASGNPLILEETQLRNTVKKLELLAQAHTDQRYQNQMVINHLQEIVQHGLPDEIAELEGYRKAAAEHPIPTDKERIASFSVNGKTYRETLAALKALSAANADLQKRANLSDLKIEYRGIEFILHKSIFGTSLEAPTHRMHFYKEDDTISPSGLITRFNNYIESFPDRIADAKIKLDRARFKLDGLLAIKDKPFEQATELENAKLRHAAVQRQLMKETQRDAVPKDQLQAFEKTLDGRKKTLEKLGFGEALQALDKPIKYSMASKEDIAFAQEILAELAEHDEFFRYPVSDKTTLEGVMKDIIPSFKYIGDDTRPDEAEESGADQRFLFKTDLGKSFYVYAKGDELWIDVSRLETGSRGSGIYMAIGNYAHNVGKVFIGDPDGLSDDAVIRRTANMLSLALRFGTTTFMEPATEQLIGNPSEGIAPLEWRGNDVDKTAALIQTFLANLTTHFPEIENLRYDFGRLQFVDRRNQPVQRGTLDRIREATNTGSPQHARAGSATTRRGAFLRALISSTSGERPRLLEHVLRGTSALIKKGDLDKLFSKTPAQKTGSTVQDIEPQVPGKIKDHVRIDQSHGNGRVEGYYDPSADKIVLIADRLDAGNVKSVLAHELLHRAIAANKDFKSIYDRFLNDFRRRFELASQGKGPQIEQAAAKRVLAADTAYDAQPEEFAAYLISEYEARPSGLGERVKKLIQDLLGHLRSALVRSGLDLKFIRSLAPSDLSTMAFHYGAKEKTREMADSNDIRYSMSLPGWAKQLSNSVASVINAHTSGGKAFNVWHKTVGSQPHKAKVNKYFGDVFRKSLDFENDIAKFANEAADEAPDILPKLNTPLDAVKELKGGWKRDKDADAIGHAIFESTVNDKAFTDAELQQKGHTPRQIKMYRQFFKAVNRSLDDLTRSEFTRLAKALKLPLAQSSLTVAAQAQHYARVAKKPEDAKTFLEIADRIKQLQAKSYAPLMRFGEYTLDMQIADPTTGEMRREFFGMFEAPSERAAMEQELKSLYPSAVFNAGVMSHKQFELFSDITPETMDVMAQMMNLSANDAFQEYLKLAISNKSVMKRLIKRKKIKGYSVDTTRVLSSFLVSNARAASRNLHLLDAMRLVAAIPKEQGDVIDEAVELYNFVQKPTESGVRLKSIMFAQYLGGSIASAAINLTQTFTTTLPYLAQFSRIDAPGILAKAMSQAASPRALSPALAQALSRADDEGHTAPHELHALYGDAMRTSVSALKVLRPVSKLWGSFFSLAEAYNRRVSFLAAYQLALKMSMADPYAFAVEAIQQTQFLYTKSSRPNWARSSIGNVIFTFKTFLINYLEFLSRLPRKEKLLALGILVFMAGAEGLPGSDDLDDLIDTIGQSLGYNTNTKEFKDSVLNDFYSQLISPEAGRILTNLTLHGISSILPFDVSQRLSAGNLIPGTSLLKKTETDRSRDALEFIGPAGSLIKRGVDAFDAASTRDSLPGKATAISHALVPKAISDAWQALDMIQSGHYRDARGRNIAETSGMDAFFKGIGFQPNAVAEQRRPERFLAQALAMVRETKADINELWAQGLFEHDQSKVEEARNMLHDWNEKNPDCRIQLNQRAIQNRVRAKKLLSRERLIKSTPKTLRRQARSLLHD